jgi:hypothetical protein
MKRITATLIAIVVSFSCGLVYAQQAKSPPEHLKPFGPMIGTWRYEGPLLEAIPDIAEKGEDCVIQASWRWILGKKAVMEDWFIEVGEGKKLSGKSLIGWNAAEGQIVHGGMDSAGGMGLGTVVFDDQGKSNRLTAETVDANGQTETFTNALKKTGKDTMTIQTVERTGGDIEGPGPVYTLKRVPRRAFKRAIQ